MILNHKPEHDSPTGIRRIDAGKHPGESDVDAIVRIATEKSSETVRRAIEQQFGEDPDA